MAFSRRLGVVSILGACWFVAVGCGDEEDRKTGTEDGGEGGESTGTSGSGGKSSIAGSQSTAGKGGTAAGSAGNNTGGTGESGSGAGGEAGSGGIVAGAGGETPGGGGEGGAATAGAGGEGGAAPTPQAKRCDYACNIDADCVIGADDTSHKCDETTKRCRVPKMCDAGDDCVPSGSFWFATCADDTGCTPDTEHCVAWQGEGYCAAIPDANFPEFPCIFGQPEMLPLFGAQGDVEVCVSKTQLCTKDGVCEPGCGEFGCEQGDGDTCNPSTGLCECASSTECTSGTSVCGEESRCECADSNDCLETSGQTGLDTCVVGTCGCASPTTCPAGPFANATKVCE